MGLIKAGMGAIGGVLGDQWKEFIYCESMKPDVLVSKGQKRLSSRGRTACPLPRSLPWSEYRGRFSA